MRDEKEIKQITETALYRLVMAFLHAYKGDYRNARVYAENAVISLKYLEEKQNGCEEG